jgi:hypothetical protein
VEIETLGHAGLLMRDEKGAPILFTDPWITGSCYWRSWWLQNYPAADLLEELKRVRYCFITHEHPDHFHTASIRVLGKGIHFLSPELPQEHIAKYLSGLGYEASVVPAFRWKTIHPDVRILSIPLFNDDSALLIDTPTAVIVNLNDSKPRSRQLRQLCRCLDETVPNKTRILLSSYSPASIVNSFIRNAERVSLRQKVDYVRYVCENCRLLKISYYMPFASQAIYKRTDSAWANDFKVTYEDLQTHWTGDGATLLPPFTRLNLVNWSHSSLSPQRYNHDEEPVRQKVHAQQALDATALFDDEDVERLRRKLNYCRWFLALLFPRGIGFELENTRLHYNAWTGKLRRQATAAGDFVLKVPAQAFKDAVEFGHFGDMGTTMFTMVMLNSAIHPRRVYLFFMVITLHDYGHTVSFRSWLKWLRNTIRIQEWRIPAPPRESAAAG